MQVSVFKSCVSARTVLRNFRLKSYFSSAGVAKKKENLWFLKVPDFKEKTPQQIEKLKIVPEEYKLIYISKDLNSVILARAVVFFFSAGGIWFLINYFNDPESIIVREGFFKKEELGYLLFIQVVIGYIYATRHVHYIFRNGNSYKTVYYGLFGKLQPRIIDHEGRQLVAPTSKSFLPFFHYLKGKPLLISSHSFLNRVEYMELVKIPGPNQ